MKNVEIKAVCRDLDAARTAAARLGAECQGTIHQVDTYFRVPSGRLKLRQATPGSDQLVYYHRPDDPQPKVSEIHMVEVAHADALCGLLSTALGVLARVAKQRELWLLDNVRIHLDAVDGLGTFIEFEILVTEEHPEAACHARAKELLKALGVSPADLVAGSYSDLLRQRAEP